MPTACWPPGAVPTPVSGPPPSTVGVAWEEVLPGPATPAHLKGRVRPAPLLTQGRLPPSPWRLLEGRHDGGHRGPCWRSQSGVTPGTSETLSPPPLPGPPGEGVCGCVTDHMRACHRSHYMHTHGGGRRTGVGGSSRTSRFSQLPAGPHAARPLRGAHRALIVCPSAAHSASPPKSSLSRCCH